MLCGVNICVCVCVSVHVHVRVCAYVHVCLYYLVARVQNKTYLKSRGRAKLQRFVVGLPEAVSLSLYKYMKADVGLREYTRCPKSVCVRARVCV